jgi:acyl carrier protein
METKDLRNYGVCVPKKERVLLEIRTNDDVLSKVQEIFRELFDIDPKLVSLQTKAADVPGWDSVGHLSLCGALEETFEIRFETSEFAEMNDVRTIVTVIESKKGMQRQTRDKQRGV